MTVYIIYSCAINCAGGRQVYAVVAGKLKAPAPSDLLDSGRTQNSTLVEEMQARLEKLQEDLNDIQLQPQSNISTNRTDVHGHPKQFPDEPLKSSTEVTGRKKVFIRSRL